MSLTTLAEQRFLPDRAIRLGIRRLLARRLKQSQQQGPNAATFAEWLRCQQAIAVETDAANAQHYEVPTQFFQLVLGPCLKYSGGYWPTSETTLAESEQQMLQLTCERAGLADGQRVLELGCGWGSLSLWMAAQYPNSRFVAMSNSQSQRQYIVRQAGDRGIGNLEVVTANVSEFAPSGQFDRVVSVEMFEHVRNHEMLLARIADWLADDGRLFVHLFCHRQFAYPFDVQADIGSESANWMSRHFFTGGIMPSFDLLRQFNRQLTVERDWWIDGTHYERTCSAWLTRLDQHTDQVADALGVGDNPATVSVQRQRWRMFFMACGELFAFDAGRQWGLGHFLLRKREASP